jgi:hypothetical protein
MNTCKIFLANFSREKMVMSPKCMLHIYSYAKFVRNILQVFIFSFKIMFEI